MFNKYKVSFNECIFITDTLGDIHEANSVNIRTIAIDSGYHERKRLELGNPFQIISDLNEVDAVICKIKI